MEERLAVTLVVLFIASVLIVGGMKFYEAQVQIDDATEYVLEDLAQKHPNADIVAIMDWEKEKSEQSGEYLKIIARVTEGLYTPCPVRMHYIYHYPEQNFVADPPEYITTSGCTVCEGAGCVIAFSEEAIIASHTNSNTERVGRYLEMYPDAIPTVKPLEDGWIVEWDSDFSRYGYSVIVESSGEIGAVETVYY